MPIYVATKTVMKNAGFAFAGGLYVHHMSLIVVKNKIIMGDMKGKSKFDQLLNESIKTDVSIEDVVVHECLHAVSGASNRTNRKYVNDEEEFVYTNSIDFYRNKKMSDEDIVNKFFLPFCMQDVFADSQCLFGLFEKVSTNPPYAGSTKTRISSFMSRYADKLVPLIIDEARKIGQKMIDLYANYGRAIEVSTQTQAIVSRGIDFNSEW